MGAAWRATRVCRHLRLAWEHMGAGCVRACAVGHHVCVTLCVCMPHAWCLPAQLYALKMVYAMGTCCRGSARFCGVGQALGHYVRRGGALHKTATALLPRACGTTPFAPPASRLPAGLSDTDAIRHAYINEWKVLAMLPVHRNVNRFLGEFVSAVPDPMFDALTPDLKELGACSQCAHTAMAMAVCERGWCP